jgi:hypothetical protein
MAGFFFCLASAEGVGLLFCPAAIQPHTSVYSGFYYVHASYTAIATKQRTEIYRGFSCNLYRSAAADTRPTQAAIIPSATRWSAHTHRDAPHRYQIPPPRRTLYSSAQPPIIIRYIRVRPFYGSMPYSAADRRPCKPGGVSSCRLQIAGTLHPAEQSSSKGTAGGAEPLTATAASLFGLSPDS